jgi:hypothetical protein
MDAEDCRQEIEAVFERLFESSTRPVKSIFIDWLA